MSTCCAFLFARGHDKPPNIFQNFHMFGGVFAFPSSIRAKSVKFLIVFFLTHRRELSSYFPGNNQQAWIRQRQPRQKRCERHSNVTTLPRSVNSLPSTFPNGSPYPSTANRYSILRCVFDFTLIFSNLDFQAKCRAANCLRYLLTLHDIYLNVLFRSSTFLSTVLDSNFVNRADIDVHVRRTLVTPFMVAIRDGHFPGDHLILING